MNFRIRPRLLRLRKNSWVFAARTGCALLLALCDCHPDRSARKMPIPTLQEFSGAEWRDPKDLSFSLPLQGVLTRLPVATCRRPKGNVLSTGCSGSFLPCQHAANDG